MLGRTTVETGAPERGGEPTALHPVQPGPPRQPSEAARKARVPTAALLVAALVLGAGGTALGVHALLDTPSNGARGPVGLTGAQGQQGPEGVQGVEGPAGPQGKTGPAGPAGKEGPAGPPGATGATGKQGPAGTIAASSIVAQPVVKTSTDPVVGTLLTATSSCPAGSVLLGGGAQVTTASAAAKDGSSTQATTTASTTATAAKAATAKTTAANGDVALKSSYPVSSGWEAVAVVTAPLPSGEVMALKSYAVCGKK